MGNVTTIEDIINKASAEYILNRGWITDDEGENIGTTDFIISKEFVEKHWNKCPNATDCDDIEDFIDEYVPEEDGEYLYQLAKNDITNSGFQDIGKVDLEGNKIK